MSKAHDPHWRYVAFHIETARSLSRRAVANAIKGRCRHEGWPDDHLPHLTRYQYPHGIVRVHHHRLAEARTVLPRITWAIEGKDKVELRLETLGVSGTIKTLTQRLGVLGKRD